MNASGIAGVAAGVALTSIGGATLTGVWASPERYAPGDHSKIIAAGLTFIVLGVTLGALGGSHLGRRARG